MRNTFVKIITVYIELFTLLLSLNVKYSNAVNYSGSSNNLNSSILSECLAANSSSLFNRNTYNSGDDKSPQTNEKELFIVNRLTQVSLPDYSVIYYTAELAAPSIPDYLLATDQKSPPLL